MRALACVVSTALLSLACHSRQVAKDPSPTLPSPILMLAGDSTYQSQGVRWTQYRLLVSNYAAFPDSLFEPAPTLPPCGANTISSRTWVQIYDRRGRTLYGHCGIVRNTGLTQLLFGRRADAEPVDSVFVMLVDRKAGVSYRSNLVSLGSR